MKQDYYKPGDWNAICDVCGWKFKASELLKRWDGAMVCKADFETRHPQEVIKLPVETNIPWSRPEPAAIYTDDPGYVATTVGVQGGAVPEGTFNEETL